MDRQNNIFLLLESMDIEPMWYHDTIQGIENEAHRKKLVVKKLFDFERIPATCKVLVIIGHSKDWFNDIIYRSRNKGIRIILVGSNPELYGEDISGSIYGVKTTVKTLLQFLSEKGANKIALVDIDKTNSIDSMKKSGFIEGCNELGLKSNESDIFEKDSEHDLDVFFRNINQYDGVIASNDACGAFILSVTKKYLINVPKDFFVCAIGDHLISKYTIPSLTSANRSYVDAGVRAVLTWKELMTSDNLLSIIQKEKTVINERQSTLGRKNGNISCSIIISRNECINGIQKMRRIQYCLSMCDYMDLKIIELILKNESNERISDLVFASSSTVAYRLKKIYENAGVEGKSQFQSLFGDEINIEEMKKNMANALGIPL